MSRLRPLLSLRGLAIILVAGLVLGAGAFAAPLLLRGPQLVRTTPTDGAQVNPRAELRLEFDQPVQADSLASAVRLDPPAELEIAAQGGVVTIRPKGGLQYGAAYTLSVDAAVRNMLGRTLAAPARVAFTTLPYISVLGVTPAEGTADIPSNTPVTIEFGAPVVSAEQVAAAADDPRLVATLPQPLTASPQVEGVGQWLSPTRYSFAPAAGWSAATTYTLTIQPQVAPDGSAQLEQPYSWSFSTGATVLAGTRPYDTQVDVPADGAVEVRLARDVDAASAAERFTLTKEGGKAVEGRTRTEQGVLYFTPAQPLERGARYKASIGPGVRAASGAAINAAALTWSFGVIGDLEVKQVIPPPDATEVLTGTRQIAVTFNHPVVPVAAPAQQAGLPQPLTINPAVQGEGRWLDTSTYIFSPTVGLDPSTTYTAQVAAGLKDQTGGELRGAYAWSFTTLAPLAYGSLPADGDRFAGPEGPLTVVFNQAMDLVSLRDALTVRGPSGAAVPGSLAAETKPVHVFRKDAPPDSDPYVSGFAVTFTPSSPMERGGRYTLEVSAAARAAGSAPLARAYSASFAVAPLPRLVASTPADGAEQAPTGEPLILTFSAPLDWGSLQQHLTIEPKPTNVYTSPNENQLYLYLDLAPETAYKVTVGAGARDPFGATLGDDASFGFTTAPLAPSLAIASSGHIAAYNSAAPARVPLQTVNIPSVSYDIYRLDQAALVTWLGASQDSERWNSLALPDTIVAGAVVRPTGARNRTELTLLDAGNLAPGAYVVEARGSGIVERQLMIVSPYTLTVKRSAGKLFVWAVDLASGKAVPGLALKAAAYSYEEQGLGAALDLGSTGGDGVLEAPFDEGNVYDPLFLWSAAGKDFTLSTTSWSDGIDAWNFSVPVAPERAAVVGSLSTDRPLYRPGDTVRLRGVLRLDQDSRYNLPEAGRRVSLEIDDSNANTVYSSTLALGDFGTFNLDLPLPAGAPLGGYSVMARLEGYDSVNTVYGSFNVAEYRKPVFEVEVAPAREDVLPGEQIEATLTARYFAGGVLAGAPVRWRLLGAPYYFSPDSAPGYQFQDLDDAYDSYRWFEGERDGGAELVAEGEGVTDAQGRLTVRLPAELGKEKSSRALTLDMEVTDIDGQVIASQGALRLHAGAFYVGVRPDGYVAEAGKPQQVALITLDPQGQPVGGRALEAGVYSREWYSVREEGPDGRFYFTSAYTDTLLQTLPATTDAQGRATVRFTPPQGGSYRIGVTGKDDAGREVRASAFTWAYGGGDVFWGVNDSNRIDLVADRMAYKPGDTASILVPAPYKGSTALLTIERGEVIEHRIFTMGGTSELLQVPITAAYAPNVYVSVVLITPAGKGADAPAAPDVRVGLISLPVSSEQQQLTVAVSADKVEAGPRDQITYTVKTTDYTGKGVPAEVALALVDKAVLSLADDPNPSLAAAFYQRRPLGVLTSQSITALADRVTLTLQSGAKGGGGGAAEGQGLPRRDFPDTAYWNPSLVTGADGTASVTLALPDSLTTWRMTANAVTKETLVGQGTSELVATRPLLVRPALPRFLTVGDKPELGAVVQNQTGAAIDATVTLEVLGEGDAASAVRLDDAAAQTVSVPANGQAIVRWGAEAVGAGQARVRLSVAGGGLEDALELPLNVQRLATPEIAASAGQVLDQTVETLRAPAGAEGELDLELTPSLAAGLRGGLSYLESFPYACAEQTVSAFLPNAVTYRLMKQLGVDDAQLRGDLDRNLAAGLQRLYAMQGLDGGWGWWAGDQSDPYLTAYVVQGLGEAVKAGYGVDQGVLDRGIAYLRDALDKGLDQRKGAPIATNLNTRAYVLFVLGEVGQPDRGRTTALLERRGQLDLYGRAYLLMALKGLGDDAGAAALAGDLEEAAIMRPTDAHWEEARPDYATMGSDTRTTALALQALVRADPSSTLVPNAVRYLMGLRDGGHWRTTQESATTLMALAEYVAQSGELAADYSYRVALGDKTLREGSAADAANEPIDLVVSLAELAQGADTPLSIQRQAAAGQSGKGRLYYTLRMRVYEDAATAQPIDRGVGVQREYIMVDTDTLSPTGQLASQAALGELVQVRLTLHVPEDMPYFMVEDMLPAGLEAVDTSLKTTSAALEDPALEDTGEHPGWWYFGRTEVRDNRVALFATDLPRGTYVYTYMARATTPGAYQALPATAMRTYAPEVFGRSAGASFTVTEP